MILMRIYYRVKGDHVHLRVFVGADEQHLALSGTLVMRAGEFMQLAKNQFVAQYFEAPESLGEDRTNG
jgi:hypothetical protein